MNENNLYYRRSMYIIDKLLNTYTNDSSFYKKRGELFEKELKRMNFNDDLAIKDMNSLFITSLVALLGLNKENIEALDKHKNYEIIHFTETDKKLLNLDRFKQLYSGWDSKRIVDTKFDDWLSVERCDYPTLCYMMNIRNGLLHSEYEVLDNFGNFLYITNSNYTHFEAKAMLKVMLNFFAFYFGNNGWTGINEKFRIYNVSFNGKIKDEEKLDNILKEVSILEIDYDIKTDKVNYVPEVVLSKYLFKEQKFKNCHLDVHQLLKKVFKDNVDFSTKVISINEDNFVLLKKMIQKYYGDEFYNMDCDAQSYAIILLFRYLDDSRSVISEWIMDYVTFYDVLNGSRNRCGIYRGDDIVEYFKKPNVETNKRSVFACKTSLLILKCYLILYRLQNSKYDDVDFNDINFDFASDDYNYVRTDKDGSVTYNFDIDKAKVLSKEPSLTDKELSNKVICEIIRDALCHGNIEMKFDIVNDKLVEYVVFDDIYHGKSRKLEITLDKLEGFLNSEAFSCANCFTKSHARVRS